MVKDFLPISYDPDNKIWTSTNMPYKEQVYGSLGEKFLKTMRSIDSNKIIDHFFDTNTQKTAKEVYEQSITVAKNLQRLGVKKGDVVVFFCMNNEHVAVLTLGCILVGALVSNFEVNLEEEHMDYVFNILQPTVLLYEEKYTTKLQQSFERNHLASLKHLISIDGHNQHNVKIELLQNDGKIDFDNFKSVEIKDPQNELAYLLLTSGSTGIPKVVKINHTLIMHGIFIWWSNKTNYEPINSDSVLFGFSPLRWISQVAVMLQSMILGIKRVSSARPNTGSNGLEVLSKSKITHVFAAPAIFHDILLQMKETDVESLESVKMVQLAGEPSSQFLLDLAKKHCVNAKIYSCYGMTEMCCCLTNDEDINGGKLLPGYQMQILDDQLRPLGPNQKGQLAVKPPYAFKGYKGIESSEFFNDKGFFVNGDYGFVDEQNNLHILARYKDLIYSNNLTIIPNPLENVVVSLPEIRVARLAGYRKTADDTNEVGAFFVILNDGVNCSHEAVSKKLFNALKSHLTADELAIIQDIHYVDEVPLTTCSKVDRVALKELAFRKSQIK